MLEQSWTQIATVLEIYCESIKEDWQAAVSERERMSIRESLYEVRRIQRSLPPGGDRRMPRTWRQGLHDQLTITFAEFQLNYVLYILEAHSNFQANMYGRTDYISRREDASTRMAILGAIDRVKGRDPDARFVEGFSRLADEYQRMHFSSGYEILNCEYRGFDEEYPDCQGGCPYANSWACPYHG
jgi:hypothetical protein